MPNRPDTPGDLGGDSAQPLSHRRLEERAVREDWPLPPDVRTKILKRLARIVDDEAAPDDLDDEPGVHEPQPKLREVIAAGRTLIAAYNSGQRLQLEREKLDLIRAKLRTHADKFVLSDVVAEAEQAARDFTPAERPAGR